MKVYIAVAAIDYEGDRIVGVYFTREKALAAHEADRAELLGRGDVDHRDIEEHDVE